MLGKNKTCSNCTEEKPLEDFYKNRDSRLGQCKICVLTKQKKYYLKNRKTRLTYAKRRRILPEVREKHRIASAVYYNTDPERSCQFSKISRNKYPKKAKARSIVSGAIRNGSLVKKPCEVCGKENVEAHHKDYSKPLEVNWLCTKHHREDHCKGEENGSYRPERNA